MRPGRPTAECSSGHHWTPSSVANLNVFWRRAGSPRSRYYFAFPILRCSRWSNRIHIYAECYTKPIIWNEKCPPTNCIWRSITPMRVMRGGGVILLQKERHGMEKCEIWVSPSWKCAWKRRKICPDGIWPFFGARKDRNREIFMNFNDNSTLWIISV